MSEPRNLSALSPLEGGTIRRQTEDMQPQANGGRVRRPRETSARSYYDVPMLKPPVWTWEISSYFFLGGLSGGAYVIARMADRFGGKEYRDVTRLGTYLAFSAFLPCPALLVADLGDRKRFHYMLRVFKPKSPMNFGAWVLTAFGAFLTLSTLKEWLLGRAHDRPGKLLKTAGGGIDLLGDVVGVPLALLLAGYTGVLLSTSATPIWTRNRWIGPLFSASALSTGAAAISLAAAAQHGLRRRAERPLKRIEMAARIAEAAALGGFLAEAGSMAKPVISGKYAPHLWGGAVGLGMVLSSILSALPAPSKKTHRWLTIGAAAATLAGGFALRWAISQAGGSSARDPEADRNAGAKKRSP